MCYFDQTRWACGFWKWGNFRQQCTKEYRTGETCGMKLVYHTTLLPEHCKVCEQMQKKERRLNKMRADVDRWRMEGNRKATIEKTEYDMQDVQNQIASLYNDHKTRERSVV